MAMAAALNGNTDHILRPRPVKPSNPMVLRAQSEEGNLKSNGHDGPLSGMSSGRSTPLPPDAPPSAQSISSARKQVRAQQKHRMFPTVEYAARVSHFDPRSEYRDFRGFFVLFWIGLAIMVITTTLRNIKDTGYPLRHQMWDLLTTKTWELGISDGVMVGSTSLSVPLQMLFRRSKGWLRWENLGMPIHSAFQIAWLILWVNWPFILNWTWTAQVFFTLHTLTLLMKMHSYAFYNGHLSTTEHRLSALDNPENASTAAAVRYPSSNTQLNEMDKAAEEKKNQDEKETLTQLREDLALELTSPLGQVTYPQNLSLYNYADYILCPTLCYELEYPRTPKIQWAELFWKTLAVFGCIFLLTIVSEEFIVPVLNESAVRLQGITSWSEMGLILAETISLLLFPFMVTFLLVFLVIFEYVLGAFAEISCFADRHFYSDWWNSCDWLEFSREWNIPVHHFLRRHVYGASRPYVSRNTATLITFLVSAFGHELVMGCITKKLRGYGFIAQMLQLPIVALQRTKIVRSRRLFNNVLFWSSMILGLAMMCALYVLAYIDTASQTIHRNLPHQLQKYSGVPLEKTASFLAKLDPAAVATVWILPLLALVFFMSRYLGSGGPHSPYTHAGGPPVRLTADDYEYVDDDGYAAQSRYRNDNYGFPSQSQTSRYASKADTAGLDPDILIMKHKGTTYPIQFPAFDIAEGKLKVGDLRRVAADQTKTDDPRRIKLLYKGKCLRDDHRACKEENLKQNSEILCVISAEPYRGDDGNESSSSSATSEMIANGFDDRLGPRVDVDGTIIDNREPRKRKGHRGGKKKRRDGRDSDRSSPRDSTSYLAPPTNGTGSSSRNPSPSRRVPSPASPPPKKPSTPGEALDMIASKFQSEFVPQCERFIERPPAEAKAKDLEYKKLSEGILAQVILKLDAVQTEGDEGLRARRKELVRQTQSWLSDLDRAAKR
ncbi:hypothetical protein OEA41_007372 [Lepraria neglecta]|uniref:BAG domain-containing protein n=1 Tax=Lepraria neglecta TaxID=209136 RepID=A0AAD9ZFN2_9LECA|nr:hypothetical protein OEA41_007372 [Lepraria neglecta]